MAKFCKLLSNHQVSVVLAMVSKIPSWLLQKPHVQGPEALSLQFSPIGQLLSSHNTDLTLCGQLGSDCWQMCPKEDYGTDSELPCNLFLGVTWVATSYCCNGKCPLTWKWECCLEKLAQTRGQPDWHPREHKLSLTPTHTANHLSTLTNPPTRPHIQTQTEKH